MLSVGKVTVGHDRLRPTQNRRCEVSVPHSPFNFVAEDFLLDVQAISQNAAAATDEYVVAVNTAPSERRDEASVVQDRRSELRKANKTLVQSALRPEHMRVGYVFLFVAAVNTLEHR
jgi:hypothetical protein